MFMSTPLKHNKDKGIRMDKDVKDIVYIATGMMIFMAVVVFTLYFPMIGVGAITTAIGYSQV